MGGLGPWAVLGLKPLGLARVVRAELDRGTVFLSETRVPPGLARELAALVGSGRSWTAREPQEGGDTERGIPVWRPFLPPPPDGQIIVRLPLPHPFQVDLVGRSGEPDTSACPAVPRIALRCAEHIARLIAQLPQRRKQSGQPLPGLPPDALSEAWWSRFDLGPFQRTGPYLSYCGPPDTYQSLRMRMLESGFLLPVDPAVPALVPLELSAGELARYQACVLREQHGD